MSNPTWKELIARCKSDGVDLSAKSMYVYIILHLLTNLLCIKHLYTSFISINFCYLFNFYTYSYTLNEKYIENH